MQDTAQNYTDISDLVHDVQDAFNIASWGHPEAEPRPAPKEHSDHIELHEAVEDEPSADLQGYVQSKPVSIDLPADVRELGVEEIEHPVQYPKQLQVKVPLSDDKIIAGKKLPLDSSFRWFAEVCLFLLHKAHIRLKVAHGKAERIFEK
jgi:hypothetical protein